jgi:hypothetical protein
LVPERTRWLELDMLSRALAVKAGFTAAGHIRGLKFIEWTYKCRIIARYSLWRVSLMVGLESTTFRSSLPKGVQYFPSWVAHSSGFVRSRGIVIVLVARSLNLRGHCARLEEFGGEGLTVDFGFFLMRKLGDETCWRVGQKI